MTIHSRLEINSPNHFWNSEDVVALSKRFKFSYNTHYPYLSKYPELDDVVKVLKDDLGSDVELLRYNSRYFHHDESEFNPNFAIFEVGDQALITLHFEGIFSLSLFCFSKERDLELPVFNKLMQDITEIPEDNETRWKFVFKTMSGFQTYDRKIICPSLEEVAGNYTNIESIKWLTQLKDPYENGKLIFWYGVPGTGKTYAIRALAREWKKAEFLYITQPESFFSDFGGMYSVLLEHCNEPKAMGLAEASYKVLVIEDALDLLLKESRAKDSSTISRLLNLTEGIIGQGLRLLVLITSNEPVKTIDDAFVRPGRCLQTTEFKPFDKKDAKEWLKKHTTNGDIKPTGNMTLAQLYEAISKSGVGIEPIGSKQRAGFQRS